MSATVAADSLWESLCKNFVYKIVAALPQIIRDGYSNHGIVLPPYKTIPLPPFDYPRKFGGFCMVDREEVGEGQLTLHDNSVAGHDSIRRSDPARFTTPDTVMTVPLILGAVSVNGKWSITQKCRHRITGQEATDVEHGTYTALFENVGFAVTAHLDPAAGRVTSLNVTLADDEVWKKQPKIALKFDNKDVPEQRRIQLQSTVGLPPVKERLRRGVKLAVESSEIGERMQKIANQILASIA
jgi:hypothetical protein